ncbi:MAG: hypothetical protein HY859_09650 [Caulobacterales bacterium]|nr:hypothetical protein [Caulobacterales bacterium]
MRLNDIFARLGALLAGVVLILGSGLPATADSWPPPRTETYSSRDGAWRLTIVPRGLTNQLDFFRDKVDGKEPAGQREGTSQEPRGRLERSDGAGGWVVVWDQPLVNDVAPVRALVADGGAYVVTFDNWHSAGYGDDVVVIYDSGGRSVRKLALTDIVPEDWFLALPRTVSSIWWGGEHLIDGESLVLKVTIPEEEGAGFDDRDYIDIVVDLKTGRVEPPQGPDWDAALTVASARAAEIRRATAERRRWFTEPLSPPIATTNEDFAWTRYLYHAHLRLTGCDEREDECMVDTVFIPAGDEAEARANIRKAFERPFFGNDVILFGSPSPERMAALLGDEVRKVGRGKLKGVSVYILAGDALWPRLKTTFAHTGGRLIQIHPDKPIPQRPEALGNFQD